MAVIVDKIEGQSARKTVDGWEITRVAVVTGLAGNAHAKPLDAVNAVEAVVGSIGSSHPSHTNAKIKELRPEPKSTDTYFVYITYREESVADDPTYAEIEVGTSLRQVETNKDINGNVISVAYTYPETYELDPAKRGKTVTQGGMVTDDERLSSIIYHRVESSSPGDKSREYSGTVNAAGWTLDSSAAEGTWKCQSIVGRSSDGGATYKVTYTFEYREYGWNTEAIYIDPDTGRPPADVEAGVGQKNVTLREVKNFNTLSL